MSFIAEIWRWTHRNGEDSNIQTIPRTPLPKNSLQQSAKKATNNPPSSALGSPTAFSTAVSSSSILEAIPLEVFVEIIQYLPHLSAVALSMTNHNIFTRVHAWKGFKKFPEISRNSRNNFHVIELYETEQWELYNREKYAYLPPEDHRCLDQFVCAFCEQLLPRKYFSENMVKRPYSKLGSRQEDRYCIPCGFKWNRYGAGAHNAVAVSTMPKLKFGRCEHCHFPRRTPTDLKAPTKWGPCIKCRYMNRKGFDLTELQVFKCILKYFERSRADSWETGKGDVAKRPKLQSNFMRRVKREYHLLETNQRDRDG